MTALEPSTAAAVPWYVTCSDCPPQCPDPARPGELLPWTSAELPPFGLEQALRWIGAHGERTDHRRMVMATFGDLAGPLPRPPYGRAIHGVATEALGLLDAPEPVSSVRITAQAQTAVACSVRITGLATDGTPAGPSLTTGSATVRWR